MNETKKSYRKILYFIIITGTLCLTTLFMNGFHDTDNVYQEASQSNSKVCDSDVSADADGYLNGRWNLWEFIGDFFSGMIE